MVFATLSAAEVKVLFTLEYSSSAVLSLDFILSTTLSLRFDKFSILSAVRSFMLSLRFFSESLNLSRVLFPLSGANKIPIAAPAAMPASNAAKTFELSYMIIINFKINNFLSTSYTIKSKYCFYYLFISFNHLLLISAFQASQRPIYWFRRCG